MALKGYSTFPKAPTSLLDCLLLYLGHSLRRGLSYCINVVGVFYIPNCITIVLVKSSFYLHNQCYRLRTLFNLSLGADFMSALWTRNRIFSTSFLWVILNTILHGPPYWILPTPFGFTARVPNCCLLVLWPSALQVKVKMNSAVGRERHA